jgi:nitroreductase
MELKKLILERRTIHDFSTEKVPDAWVKEALELSLWAPNHRFTFPWFFALVEGEARARLGDLAVMLKGKEAARAIVTNPSHFLSVGIKLSGNPKIDHENYATLACSIQILSMALWEKGAGCKWTTSGFTKHAKTYEILGISPQSIQLEGAVFIGKAAAVPMPVDRPALDSILVVSK